MVKKFNTLLNKLPSQAVLMVLFFRRGRYFKSDKNIVLEWVITIENNNGGCK